MGGLSGDLRGDCDGVCPLLENMRGYHSALSWDSLGSPRVARSRLPELIPRRLATTRDAADGECALFTLGHLSDWHATPLAGAGVSEFLNKRIFGWLSWNVKRGRVHRPEVLEALFDDVQRQAPDHVAITGDLTNVALEQEFVEAARWLERLGAPDWVSVIPGNHDAYVRVVHEHGWQHWSRYVASDPAEGGSVSPAGPDDFPTLRVRGPVALVGVCSAIPTPPFMATGRVGDAQLARLETLLAALRDRGLCRVVLLHHPPNDEDVVPRRRLGDSARLREVLGRVGAELVLHGHRHRTILRSITGPEGEIPVVGVRSSSDVGSHEYKRAQYHIYRIERAPSGPELGPGRFAIQLATRGYDPQTGAFVSEGSVQQLTS